MLNTLIPSRSGRFFVAQHHTIEMADTSYWSVEEVAQYFGVNPSTIYRLAQRGAFPGFKIGGQWRFSKAMLDSWVATQVNGERLKEEDRRDGAGSQGGTA